MSASVTRILVVRSGGIANMRFHNLRELAELPPEEAERINQLTLEGRLGIVDGFRYSVQIELDYGAIIEEEGIPEGIIYPGTPLYNLVSGLEWKPGSIDLRDPDPNLTRPRQRRLRPT